MKNRNAILLKKPQKYNPYGRVERVLNIEKRTEPPGKNRVWKTIIYNSEGDNFWRKKKYLMKFTIKVLLWLSWSQQFDIYAKE